MIDKEQKYTKEAERLENISSKILLVASVMATITFYLWFFLRDITSPTWLMLLGSSIVLATINGYFMSKSAKLSEDARIHKSEQNRLLKLSENSKRVNIKPKSSTLQVIDGNIVNFPNNNTDA